MEELFKEIPGCPGYYASNLGRIKGPYGIINGHYGKGYVYVYLRKIGSKKRASLVALTWIPNPDNKSEVDHINTKRDDDRVDNLRWATHKENINNPTTLMNKSNSMKGKNTGPNTDEHNKHIREANLGKVYYNDTEGNKHWKKGDSN